MNKKRAEISLLSYAPQHHLRSLRQQRGLTLQQVSRGTGLSISAVHDIEKHYRVAKLTTAFKLARFYGLAVANIWQPLLQQITTCMERTEGQSSGGFGIVISAGVPKGRQKSQWRMHRLRKQGNVPKFPTQ